MNPIFRLTLLSIVVSLSGSYAQGTFQNLNFESPVTPLNGVGNPATVGFTNAFPNWTGYIGTNLATRARIDGVNLDNATHAIVRSNRPGLPLIEGNYTAVLQAGRDPFEFPQPINLVSVSLAQSSLVPVDSMSLLFKAYTAGTPFAVTLGGQNIPIFALESFSTYTLYGGNIAAFAGSTTELRFTAFPDNYPGSTVFALDSIQFSNQPIPEPSTFALFAFGALLLVWKMRTLRHSKKTE